MSEAYCGISLADEQSTFVAVAAPMALNNLPWSDIVLTAGREGFYAGCWLSHQLSDQSRRSVSVPQRHPDSCARAACFEQ